MSIVRACCSVAIAGALLAGAGITTHVQSQVFQAPFLFTTLPVTTQAHILTGIEAGYSERAFEPVAGERLEPRAGAMVTLAPFVALQGQFAAAATLDHQTRIAEQMELMVTPLRAGAFSLGTNLGIRHEYTGTMVAMARLVGARMTATSALAADVLLEHPYAGGRDAVDVITTFGATRALTSRLWLGVEAVGSDLEGFWDPAESEGGATVLVGPTFAATLSDRWRLVIGGGPVLRATTSRTPVPMADGVTPLAANQRAGYVLRTSLRAAW